MAEDATDTESTPTYTYECSDCGMRIDGKHQPSTCSACGGEMQNISLSRGQ